MSADKATCFQALQDAKEASKVATAAYDLDIQNEALEAVDADATAEVEKKTADFESAQQALDDAIAKQEGEYIARQPGSKATQAILQKRARAATQAVKQSRAAHIAAQKAIERAMALKKVPSKEYFADLREKETAAKAAYDAALQAAQASPATASASNTENGSSTPL